MSEIAIAAFKDFQDGDYRVFAVDDFEIGVFRLGDRVIAYVEEALTPDKKSAGLRFSKRRNVVCPWHGYEYDLETGCHPGDPTVRLTAVKVEVRGGQIYIGVPETN